MSFSDSSHTIAGTGARRVLVAGATGRFGGITGMLLARGHQVRAATRDLAAIAAGVLPTPVPPVLPLQQVATADILALSVAAIEAPDVFAGERIEVASDAPTGEEAAAALSSLLGRGFAARQLPGPGVP